jgi:hypothetical protein
MTVEAVPLRAVHSVRGLVLCVEGDEEGDKGHGCAHNRANRAPERGPGRLIHALFLRLGGFLVGNPLLDITLRTYFLATAERLSSLKPGLCSIWPIKSIMCTRCAHAL